MKDLLMRRLGVTVSDMATEDEYLLLLLLHWKRLMGMQ